MQCLFGLVNEPYFNLFSSIGFNFKVLILGAWGLRPTYGSAQKATPHTVCTSTPWVWGPQDTLGKGVGLWPEAKVYLIKVGSEVWTIGNTSGKGVEVKEIAKV